MTRTPGCLPAIIPDSSAIGLVQMSDQNGNVSWQPVTAPDLPTGSTSAAGILQLDGTAGHIQPVGTTASAGNQGLAADSKHQHAWGQAAPAGFTPANPTATTSQAPTLVMMGLGTTCAYTPLGSGLVLVNVTGFGTTATAVQSVGIGGRYGTGTAPANGATLTGTRFGGVGDGQIRPGAFNNSESFALTALLTLTPSTAYWFDIAISTGATADAASITNVSMTLVELP